LSKKVDRIMDEAENPEAQLPPPRAARFGEGQEGKGVRRERGLSSPRVGPAGRLAQFLRDVRAEMRRVSWPSATEVKNTTIITLIAVIFFAAYLFLADQALSRLINGITWLANKVFGIG
jgi:preprotein translocase subunit SecE